MAQMFQPEIEAPPWADLEALQLERLQAVSVEEVGAVPRSDGDKLKRVDDRRQI